MIPRRVPGNGWIVLIGGGEFSFGETELADAAWLEKTSAGSVGFVPTASGSDEYGQHFADYLEDGYDRKVSTIPIYRTRDARRGRNGERIDESAAIYLGAGVAEHLTDVLVDSLALEHLGNKLKTGGVVAAIGASAQALGVSHRDIRGAGRCAGLGWLPGGVVEINFDPSHDRRLRQMLTWPGVEWGLGLPAGSAVLMGPDETVEWVGPAVVLDDPEGDFSTVGDLS